MKVYTAFVFIALLLNVQAHTVEHNPQFWEDLVEGIWLILQGVYHDFTTYTPDMGDDAYKDDAEMYQSEGYRFEIHKVITPDNYILSAWRVPGKLTESMSEIRNKQPVMLQHGFLDNSATWTVNRFNETLVSLLLEAGYDVWMTNTRGNFNSYQHVNPRVYSVFDSHSSYWNFTLDDMAIYDLPANIDYILDYTNNDQLTYVGHSQGTFQFFAGNCLKDLASKVKKFIGVGPVMYVNHAYSPLVVLASKLKLLKVLDLFDANNILLWPTIVGVGLNSIANFFRLTIWRVIQFICGVSKSINIDLSRVPVIGRREPGGSSLLNMDHWLQLYETGRFQMMDFGKKKNMEIYGQPTPPQYDVETMKKNLKDLDILLIKGGNDALVSDEDFNHLLSHFEDKIGKTLEHFTVPDYGHLDYIWAKDSFQTTAIPIMDFIKKD